LRHWLVAAGEDVVNLCQGNPDLATPPHIVEALRREVLDPATHRYGSFSGLLEPKAAIGDWYAAHHGVRLDPETEVAILFGAKAGLVEISQRILAPGDVCLMPDPVFPDYWPGVVLARADLRPLPLRKENGFLPDYAEPDPVTRALPAQGFHDVRRRDRPLRRRTARDRRVRLRWASRVSGPSPSWSTTTSRSRRSSSAPPSRPSPVPRTASTSRRRSTNGAVTSSSPGSVTPDGPSTYPVDLRLAADPRPPEVRRVRRRPAHPRQGRRGPRPLVRRARRGKLRVSLRAPEERLREAVARLAAFSRSKGDLL
jgi:hypothetical protein